MFGGSCSQQVADGYQGSGKADTHRNVIFFNLLVNIVLRDQVIIFTYENENDLAHLEDNRFGKIERDGKTLYRFRSRDWRFYFEVIDDHVRVHRVLHKNTFQDFLFRSNLPFRAEDEELAQSKQFWRLIDEGRKAKPSS